MQSKAFVLLVAAFMALPAALAAPGQSNPESTPGQSKPESTPEPTGQHKSKSTPEPKHLTCGGDLYCCSKGLQGNVGYYCGDSPITQAQVDQCSGMVIVCCVKGAGKDLTPRGYTYTGCSMPGTSS